MINKDDPRLIDYALGEMTPEEAAAFAAVLNQPENEEARQTVREFQQVAGVATDALAAEPKERLHDEQRTSILDQATAKNTSMPHNKVHRFRLRRVVPVALAACLIGAFAWLSMTVVLRTRSAGRIETASRLETVREVESLPYAPEPPIPDADAADIQEYRGMAPDRVDGEGAGERARELAPEVETLSVQTDVRRDEFEGRPDLSPPASSAPLPAEVAAGETRRPRSMARESLVDRARPGVPPLPPLPPLPPRRPSVEEYLPIDENPFHAVRQHPLSTFSIDVDTASYSNVRRFLQQGQLPPPDAVRIEEMVNYFQYDLPEPEGEAPFSVTIEMADCPWADGHKLARVALQGKSVSAEERGPANLVFLVDVSGSMGPPNRLPLAKEAMKALLHMLEPRDRVAIVTYAGTAEVNLPSTPCTDKETIRAAIDALQAGGSTHGSAGIQKAYRIARENFVPGGVNRVILATDGDFNVGVTSHDALMEMIAEKAKSNVFLTILGFGYGNLKDATLEQLANRGNGNYAYIDTFAEARRVLVEQLSGTLITIAKDVKIQVEFNPQHVQAYRLIGYENRMLEARDFNDDTKDAGEIGAGHQVTALYQLVPQGARLDPGVDPLRYQPEPEYVPETTMPHNPEWMTVKLRYKEPEGDRSRLLELPWTPAVERVRPGSPDMRFAAGVAAFGMVLRDSQHRGNADFDLVLELAESGKKDDHERQAFIDLVVAAKILAQR